MADVLKAKGNAAFSEKNFQAAVEAFSAAIELDPSNHVLYSNRSAAYASQSLFEKALEDANKVVELKPEWPKGYSRVGAARFGLQQWEEAEAAYAKGLELDPTSEQLQSGLDEAKAAARRAAGPPGGGLFTSPDALGRLVADARTRGLMGQPDFMSMLQDVSANPQNMQKYLGDDRFQLALEVALGLRMQAGPRQGEPPGRDDDSGAAEPMQEDTSVPAAAQPQQVEAEEEPAPVDEAAAAERQAQAAANAEKEAGNIDYKAKRFDEAIAHYTKAIELYDRDISFLSNRAAAHFEAGDLDACIADCDAAVERGRELRADYKVVARAMTRKGNALVKQGRLEEAIAVYGKSLTEHRNADTLKRLHDTERALKEGREAEYVDLELSNAEKDKGNEAFRLQNYPDAVRYYTEALKRGPPAVNPEAHKLYSNRAACYTKLGAWADGLKDADECIRLRPDFSKGYSRKGHLQYFMKEFDKAMETYEAGLRHDPDNAELQDGMRRCIEGINKVNRGDVTEAELKERQAKAMADPEVQSILTDPVMRQVLRDMQEDPSSAQKHLAHPDISRKIEKLVAAGIVQLR